MIDVLNNNMFHLHNEKVSYVINILPNGHLGHAYYGKKLGKISIEDIQYMTSTESKSAGTVKFSPAIPNFSLQDQYQEVPVYGTSDFKEGLIKVSDEDDSLYLDFQYISHTIKQGKPRSLAIPASFAKEGQVESITFCLEDSFNQLRLEVTFSIFENSGTIARGQKLTNLCERKRKIQRFLSGALDMKNQQFDFLHLSGAWLKERHIKRHSLEQGTVSVGSLKGASSHQHNPFIALLPKGSSNHQGDIYGANLIYSGNFLAQTELDEWDNLRLLLGIHPEAFSWELKQNEAFETPEMLLHYTDEGLNGLMQETSCFIEKHVVNPIWNQKERPVVLNNWEATYFDFDHDKLLRLAAEGKKLGIDCFVLDDGWFGQRDSDRVSLGDWFEDSRKFPKGIATFAKDIHDLDLQFGLWFEPEMVSPESELYKKHPEWVVRHTNSQRIAIGRGQYVLDFSNPEVVETIYQQMKNIISATKLEYIKWDMNRNITQAYSSYLKQQKIDQAEFFHRYILGVYRLYERILSEFPDVLIEGCAGGGGRYDLGILFYSPQIWPSDDSDPIERLAIQSGTLLGYPLSSFSNHVSAAPNHQVQRQTSLEMRTNVAMFGPLGYELNIFELSEQEQEQIKKDILFYKKHQALLTFGRFYQLTDILNQPNEYGWAVYDEVQGQGIICFYRILTEANSSNREFIKLPFVKENESYLVNGEKLSGNVMNRLGIRKPYQFNSVNGDKAQVKGDYQSFVYKLKRQ
ncbi:alpha-galactosidase [Enterococcus sp. DIV0756]|uniref:alpha-galactosidase n=1 Tax=Enterococcus sp. DIV0756 TaxID=2774636 RepID=UPI003F26DD9D